MKNFRIIAKYYVGYGANLRRLRGVRNEYYRVAANSAAEAVKKLKNFNGRCEAGISAGWIFEVTDKARKYHCNTIVIN